MIKTYAFKILTKETIFKNLLNKCLGKKVVTDNLLKKGLFREEFLLLGE